MRVVWDAGKSAMIMMTSYVMDLIRGASVVQVFVGVTVLFIAANVLASATVRLVEWWPNRTRRGVQPSQVIPRIPRWAQHGKGRGKHRAK